jgi:hypothetical protein
MRILFIMTIAGVVLGACGRQTDRLETISERPGYFAGMAEAADVRLDRTKPDWLRNYCFGVLEESAQSPVTYSRKRGPFFTMTPLSGSERWMSAQTVETCTQDYYILPVADEAFLQMGVEHTWSETVWRAFHEATAASIAAQLDDLGWRRVDQVGELPTSFERVQASEQLREYLDVYFTKNEEFVFELVVVEP